MVVEYCPGPFSALYLFYRISGMIREHFEKITGETIGKNLSFGLIRELDERRYEVNIKGNPA